MNCFGETILTGPSSEVHDDPDDAADVDDVADDPVDDPVDVPVEDPELVVDEESTDCSSTVCGGFTGRIGRVTGESYAPIPPVVSTRWMCTDCPNDSLSSCLGDDFGSEAACLGELTPLPSEPTGEGLDLASESTAALGDGMYSPAFSLPFLMIGSMSASRRGDTSCCGGAATSGLILAGLSGLRGSSRGVSSLSPVGLSAAESMGGIVGAFTTGSVSSPRLGPSVLLVFFSARLLLESCAVVALSESKAELCFCVAAEVSKAELALSVDPDPDPVLDVLDVPVSVPVPVPVLLPEVRVPLLRDVLAELPVCVECELADECVVSLCVLLLPVSVPVPVLLLLPVCVLVDAEELDVPVCVVPPDVCPLVCPLVVAPVRVALVDVPVPVRDSLVVLPVDPLGVAVSVPVSVPVPVPVSVPVLVPVAVPLPLVPVAVVLPEVCVVDPDVPLLLASVVVPDPLLFCADRSCDALVAVTVVPVRRDELVRPSELLPEKLVRVRDELVPVPVPVPVPADVLPDAVPVPVPPDDVAVAVPPEVLPVAVPVAVLALEVRAVSLADVVVPVRVPLADVPVLEDALVPAVSVPERDALLRDADAEVPVVLLLLDAEDRLVDWVPALLASVLTLLALEPLLPVLALDPLREEDPDPSLLGTLGITPLPCVVAVVVMVAVVWLELRVEYVGGHVFVLDKAHITGRGRVRVRVKPPAQPTLPKNPHTGRHCNKRFNFLVRERETKGIKGNG